ncbi:hypothetical protein [Vibrio sp. MA40-2]|uniref:hypothetical protein n=1 Tax=Vibrio sp. MA40-2 TaxID=3391828 RepID=UPI0026853E37
MDSKSQFTVDIICKIIEGKSVSIVPLPCSTSLDELCNRAEELLLIERGQKMLPSVDHY